ncbi:hypothetical protein D0Y65_054775 [Glycine soja]|uniref:Uncharacterized protein n=1 Tax=Glycine soja TaxID=3848 RepID=A0A445F8G4_GLYSO|nr:hypothetical protein D0Y65_054775 [Glycine soja]
MVRSTMEEVAVHVTALVVMVKEKDGGSCRQRQAILTAYQLKTGSCIREQNVMIGRGTWASFCKSLHTFMFPHD